MAIETSAKTGENVEMLFTMASKLLYDHFKNKIVAMVSNYGSVSFTPIKK